MNSLKTVVLALTLSAASTVANATVYDVSFKSSIVSGSASYSTDNVEDSGPGYVRYSLDNISRSGAYATYTFSGSIAYFNNYSSSGQTGLDLGIFGLLISPYAATSFGFSDFTTVAGVTRSMYDDSTSQVGRSVTTAFEYTIAPRAVGAPLPALAGIPAVVALAGAALVARRRGRARRAA